MDKYFRTDKLLHGGDYNPETVVKRGRIFWKKILICWRSPAVM